MQGHQEAFSKYSQRFTTRYVNYNPQLTSRPLSIVSRYDLIWRVQFTIPGIKVISINSQKLISY